MQGKNTEVELSSWRFFNTSPIREGCACGVFVHFDTSDQGHQATTPILITVRIPVSANRPDTPIKLAIIGAN